MLGDEVAVLVRHVASPGPDWADLAMLAALARLLPGHLRLRRDVAPGSRLAGHRRLVGEGWTCPGAPGRPPVPDEVRAGGAAGGAGPALGLPQDARRLSGLGHGVGEGTAGRVLAAAGLGPRRKGCTTRPAKSSTHYAPQDGAQSCASRTSRSPAQGPSPGGMPLNRPAYSLARRVPTGGEAERKSHPATPVRLPAGQASNYGHCLPAWAVSPYRQVYGRHREGRDTKEHPCA